MRFSLATIATAALFLSASAAPHSGYGKDRNSTDIDEQGSKGPGRGRYADGTFGSDGKPSNPTLSGTPTPLPNGDSDLNDVPFELPSSDEPGFIGVPRAESKDSKSSGSSSSSEKSDSKAKPKEKASDSSKSEDKKSSSSSGDKETTGSGDKETSSGSGDKKPASGSGDKTPAAGTEKPASGSGDKKPASGTGDKKPASGTGDKKPASGTGDEEPASGTGDEEPASGTGDEEPASGSGDKTPAAGTEKPASGSGDKKPASGGSSSGGTPNATTPSKPSGGATGGTKASGAFPAAAGESTLSAPMEVTDFDGGLVKFGRGASCSSGEGGNADAVFIVAEGGSLSNVIIGADQIEGVHCLGACTITNVWWEAVCEDALSFKGNGDGTVTGGGARGAKDKVIQHNGVGTISISGFHVEDFGKLYRSCGNCKTQGERHVKLEGIKASGGSSTLVGINSNFGDTATIKNSCITGTSVICQEFEGTTPGNEPKKLTAGPSAACIYTDADISAC